MAHKILLVEDDIELAKMMKDYLANEGYHVDHVPDGLQAIDKILHNKPDIVLLDVMLPGADGIKVVRTIRPDYTGIVIMLTAKDDDLIEANSLNFGADGFLEKPVRPHILLAHIRAHLRRSQDREIAAPKVLRCHGLLVNMGKYEAYLDDKMLALTSMEFKLLAYLTERQGNLVTRNELYQALGNIEYDGIDRSMDMRVSTLRKKMDDELAPYRYIKTIRGRGYLLSN